MKAVVFNLGCKTNRYESDAMAEELRNAGFMVSADLVFADVYIVNTCAVTAEAEKKSRQSIARMRAKNMNAKIFVCGCASEKNPASFHKENVTYVIGTAEKSKLVKKLIEEQDCLDLDFQFERQDIPSSYEEFINPPSVDRTRASLKIQDGCNNFCSYCIIPYLRGRSRSRSVVSIVQEAEYLDGKTKEIVLTGINLSAYGKDIGTDLETLIRKLSHLNARIRLGSFYVEGVTEGLLAALATLKSFCPQFHLSLQSGDNDVLKAMNRKYTTADYQNSVKMIRDKFPLAGITTDVIVGYPTETEEMFANTVSFLKEIAFSDIHVFVFSKRDGTAAANLKELSSDVKDVRKLKLLALKEELVKNFLQKNLFCPQELLVETKEGNEWIGYSENYLRVYTNSATEIQTIIPIQLYKDGIK